MIAAMQFTFAQATEICEDFEDLKDTEFLLGGILYVVNDIIICPFEVETREVFLNDFAGSTVNGFNGDDCAVMLYAEDLATGRLHFIDILAYIEEKGVNYNFPA